MMHGMVVYEDELEAIRDAVKALGGAKTVGQLYWPDKTVENAQRYLLDCLNPARAERLSPSQVLFLMRKARSVGFHGLAEYFMQEAGYNRPVPINPETEAAVLVHEMDTVLDRVSHLAERLERLRSMGPTA